MQNGSEEPPRYLIESVDQALRLLLLFQTKRTLRVTDVAQEFGIARSSAHRLLSTLAWRGFVSQDRVNKSYRAGRILVQIGLNSIRDLDVRRRAHQHLESVSAQTHETVNLLVLEGGGSRFIDGVESDRPLRVGVRTGALLPAYATAGGKALIADLSADELNALYPRGLRPVTKMTVVDLAALGEQLAVVRDQGYALNINESEVGLRAVAVPIRDHAGRAIASLAVSTPANRMTDDDVPGMVAILLEASAAIGADLV